MDLENCLRFLDELKNHTYGSTPYEALLIAAVVFYARPFSQNEKKGSLHPSEPRVPESVLSRLSQDEITFHESVVTLRNKAIAHAEWSHHPAGVSSNGIIQAMPFSIWQHFQDNVVGQFRNLASKVRRAVQHEQANELRN